MNVEHSSQSPTTVRRLTSNLTAAIATIAVDGPLAVSVVSQSLFTASGRVCSLLEPCAKFARWRFRDSEMAEEHVVVLARSLQSIEIHCHGGVAVTERIVQELLAAGCVGAADFPKTDHQLGQEQRNSVAIEQVIRQAARRALIQSPTLKSAVVLLEQFQGSLAREFVSLLGLIERWQFDEAKRLRDILLDRARFGLKLLNPWRLTLAGPPNVGKSSLMNALCGANRVLVHHEPGTTRDAIDTPIVIGGWPLVLTDTAGVRQACDAVEQQGVVIARQRWRQADIGLMVVDARVGWTSEHSALLQGPGLFIVLINKIDLVRNPTDIDGLIEAIKGLTSNHAGCHGIVTSSALQADGLSNVVDALGDLLEKQRPPTSAGVPFTDDQVAWLQRVRTSPP